MKLIILSGRQQKGKTTTLCYVEKKLKTTEKEIWLLDGKGFIKKELKEKLDEYLLKNGKEKIDYVAKIKFKDLVIGISTKGDDSDYIMAGISSLFSLLKSEKEKYDVIITSCRNYEKNSFEKLKAVLETVTIFKKFYKENMCAYKIIEKKENDDNTEYKKANLQDARLIYNKIFK